MPTPTDLDPPNRVNDLTLNFALSGWFTRDIFILYSED